MPVNRIFLLLYSRIFFVCSLFIALLITFLSPSLTPMTLFLPVTISLIIWGIQGGMITAVVFFLLMLWGHQLGTIPSLSSIVSAFLFSLIILFIFGSRLNGLIAEKEKNRARIKEMTGVKEKMEHTLYESQTRIGSLISNVPGAIYRCVFDDTWTMKFISDEVECISGYPAHAVIENKEISYSQLIHPEDFSRVREEISWQVMKDSFYDLEYRLITRDGYIRWVNERGQGVRGEDGTVVWLDGVIVDITEQKLAEQDLLKEKKQLDVTLRSIGEGVIATDAEGRVVLFNRMAEELTGWTEEEALQLPVYKVYRIVDQKRGKPCGDPVKKVLKTGKKESYSNHRGLITRKGEEISIADIAAPIIVDEEIVGVVLVFRDITQEKRDERERMHLLEETRRGLNESLSLQMVTAALLQMINLQEVLELVCSEAEGLTGSGGSCVFLLEDEHWLSPVYSSGVTAPRCDRVPVKGSLTGLALKNGEPIVSNRQTLDSRRYEPERDPEPDNLLAVPLMLKDEKLGALTVFNKPGGFHENDVRVISLFASQAAVAIENARLYKKAQELAAMKERQRLARDLHDAVSQTLFSASLISEVLPVLWEKDKKEGLLRLEELKELTRGALAEMRALLLELRPQGLMETDLDELINYLADAVRGRARIPVSVEIKGDVTLPPDIHVAFYRILQESVNNIVKHAKAKLVTIKMEKNAGMTKLSVQDDGCGFEKGKVSQDRFGLKIMEERAQEIGGRLSIHSKEGQGTTISVLWSEEQEGEDYG